MTRVAAAFVAGYLHFGLAWEDHSSVEEVPNWDRTRMTEEHDSFVVAGKLPNWNAGEEDSRAAAVVVVAVSIVKVEKDVTPEIPARCSPFRRSNLG